MAGSKLIPGAKLKASTILEVVIAMVVIMAIFSIAMMIYANVMRSSLSTKKILAEALVNETMLNSENANVNETRSFSAGDFRIEQVVNSYNDNPKLLEIDLSAYDVNQQKITELKKVIINKNE